MKRWIGWPLVVLAGLLAACSSGGSTGHTHPATPVKGGTATVALSPGNQFNWIFPLLPIQYAIGANIEDSEYLMWRPLYWFGGPGKVGVNDRYSLADPATFTTRGGKTVATIQLKPYRWSDGKPVTTRDVQFWFNVLKAAKQNWWDYVAGQFPDNVSAFTVLSPTRFSITFNGTYSPSWLYNELGQLIPIPQHAWDRESASGPVGNYDMSPAGAKSVYNFLAKESKSLSTYASNPLWKVVDGPWRLTSFVPATGDATYTRNSAYSGPATGSLQHLRVLSFTSDTSEFNALLSGAVTYGYIPFNSAAQVKRVASQGYRVAPWPTWGITYITPNLANPRTGPILRQLYVRQAMERLIDQPLFIKDFLHGYGNPTYGPVPLVPSSRFVAPAERTNPYPYDPAAATALLRSHGWRIVPNGADVCVRPGTGAGDCGAGVPAGAKLTFSFEYATGVQAVTQEVAVLRSTFSKAGIGLSLRGGPFNTVAADDVSCSKPSCWQLNYYGQGWYFDPGYNIPDGGAIWDSAGASNGGGYSNKEADTLIGRLHTGGLPALYAYQTFLARDLPVLWMPQLDGQISAVSTRLGGALPQDPLGNIYPENWSIAK